MGGFIGCRFAGGDVLRGRGCASKYDESAGSPCRAAPQNFRTALSILRLMALATATEGIALFIDTVDAPFYVVDGDTLALARERIRLFGIDAPETRDARSRRRALGIASF